MNDDGGSDIDDIMIRWTMKTTGDFNDDDAGDATDVRRG